jgi:kinesin family member C1
MSNLILSALVDARRENDLLWREYKDHLRLPIQERWQVVQAARKETAGGEQPAENPESPIVAEVQKLTDARDKTKEQDTLTEPTGLTDDIELIKKTYHEATVTISTLQEQALLINDDLQEERNKIELLTKQLGDQATSFKLASAENHERVAILEEDLSRNKMQLKRALEVSDKLYKELWSLRGKIRTYCRIRPPRKTGSANGIRIFKDVVVVPTRSNDIYVCAFDRVFPITSQEQTIYDGMRMYIESAILNENSCIIAYGQSGTGKTRTVRNIIRRAAKDLFSCGQWRLLVREVYMDKINVLYDQTIDTAEKLAEAQTEIEKERSVGTTELNAKSSRSHLIYSFTNLAQAGSLTLADLAGNERVARSGAKGKTLKEACATNQGLSSLVRMLIAIKNSSKMFDSVVRESKLNQVLAESWTLDNVHISAVITCSSEEVDVQDTRTSLRFVEQLNQVSIGGKPEDMESMVSGSETEPESEAESESSTRVTRPKVTKMTKRSPMVQTEPESEAESDRTDLTSARSELTSTRSLRMPDSKSPFDLTRTPGSSSPLPSAAQMVDPSQTTLSTAAHRSPLPTAATRKPPAKLVVKPPHAR